MLGRTGLWLSSFLLCATVAANDLIGADTALMRGDYGAAAKILQEHADGGNVTAMVRLANLYHRGEGVVRNPEKAVALYLAAAETGNAEAQFNLGNMYLLGEGLPQDEDWALTFYRLAAAQGHRMAERNMRELARATGIEIAGAGAAPAKPLVSDDMDLIDTPTAATRERLAEPITSPVDPESFPDETAIMAARPSEPEGGEEGRTDVPAEDTPPVAAGIAGAPAESEPAVERMRIDDVETQPAVVGEISSTELEPEQASVVPLPSPPTAPTIDPTDEPESDLARPAGAGVVVARAATDAEIAAAMQHDEVDPDVEVDGGVVAGNETTSTAEIMTSPTRKLAESGAVAITDEPVEDTAESATTLLVIDPIDAEIEQPVSEVSADEAKARRLAQDHGIAVQLGRESRSPTELETTAGVNLPEDKLELENLPVVERFARAQGALDRQDFQRARELLQALASDGYAPAPLLLADMAERGAGMGAADPVLAKRWLERAAALGSSEAQYQLAERHLNGDGVDPDEAMAITFYRDAARGGHKMAQEKLRVIFAEAGLPMPDFTDKPKTTPPRTPVPVEDLTAVDDTVSPAPNVVSEPVSEPSRAVADNAVTDVTSASGDAPLPVPSKPLIVEEHAPAVSVRGSDTELLQPATRISKPDFAVEGPITDMPLKIDDAMVESEPERSDRPASSVPSPEMVVTQIESETAAAVDSLERSEVELVTNPAVELPDEHVDDPNAEELTAELPVVAVDTAEQQILSPEMSSAEAPEQQAVSAKPAPSTTINEADRQVAVNEIPVEATPDPPSAIPDPIPAEVVNEQPVEVRSADEAEALRLAQQHGIDVQLAGDSTPIGERSGDTNNPTEVRDLDPDMAALAERYEGAQRMLRLENFDHGVNRLTELANEGYAPAASLLADMAERGEGMAVDVEQALTWRREAARLGSPDAQYQLAEMHMHGTVVEPDEAMAITYYRDAARGGHEDAKEKLQHIYADAGIPMPDFSRPRQPIAIYTPTTGNGSVDTSASAGSRIARVDVETAVKMGNAERPTPAAETTVAEASDTLAETAPVSLAADPEPIHEADATTVVPSPQEGSADLAATNSGLDAVAASTAETSPEDLESSDDSLTELIVPELVGDEPISAFTDEASTEAEASTPTTALAGPEATAPSVRAPTLDASPAIDPPVVTAGAAVGASAALGANVATQPRKGFFGRLKGLFSRDKADASDAVAGQHISETESEPVFAPDVAVTETEAETMTASDVQLAAVDTGPSPSLEPSGAETDDTVDMDPAITTPAETDLETRSTQVSENTETVEFADTGSTPAVTIDDGKRALADRQFANAIEIFTELANEGNAEAQAHLGYMYYKGEGVDVDLGLAVEWYERAAVLGNRDAQYNLAVAYAFGEGVAQDDAQAVTWYRRAAEQGSAIAQYSLGVSYALGEGVERDDAQAVSWYRAAAKQGYAAAQYNLGYGYRTGNGVEADDTQALRWFLAAAQNGHAAAQYSLGYMYRSGRGVERNLNEAIKWYRLAADQGHPDARADLASLNTGDS